MGKSKKAKKSRRNLSVQGKGSVSIPGVGAGSGSLSVVHTRAPVAKGNRTRTLPPSVNGGRNFVVKHSEFIADINGSAGYAVTSYPINPGLSVSFPWLAGLASNFEQYRIKSLRYRLETTAPTTTIGTMMLAIDYDPADSQPITKQEFLVLAGATRAALWDSCMCAAAPSRRAFSPLFVRTGALDANLDIKTYDYGVLNVATEAVGVTTGVAELYVDYEIEFISPENNLGDPITSGSYSCAFTSTNGNAPFSATPGGPPQGGLPIVFTPTSFRINKAGTYLFVFVVTGTKLVANVSPTFTPLSTNNPGQTSTAVSFTPTGNITCATTTLNDGTKTQWISMVTIYTAGDGFSCQYGVVIGGTGTLTGTTLNVAPWRPTLNTPRPYSLVCPGVPSVSTRPSKELEKEEDSGSSSSGQTMPPLPRDVLDLLGAMGLRVMPAHIGHDDITY